MMRLLAIAITALLGLAAQAQPDLLVEALRSYQAGELMKARLLVDEAVQTPAHAQDAEAWLLRGFIYKDLFKGMPGGEKADEVRDEALNSLMNSLNLDEAGTYVDNAVQAYDFLARSCFNDAAKALNEQREDRAVELFTKYKAAVLRREPQTSLKARETEFYNALGTAYTKRFNQQRQDTSWFLKATEAYGHVLGIEPDNYGANYNLATLHYNRGVYNIRAIKAEDDIPTIQQIQEVSRTYFQQALPYMLKAHELDPTRRETLLGLEGIYYSLQDQDSSERYRQLFELLPPQNDN
ncbi:MAG: hypothetical protein R2817_12465 [Flavobacteriales bacterium]